MNLTLELPKDTLIISRDDLKDTLREMMSEINEEQAMDDVMKIDEAAVYLKVSVPTLRKMIANNDVPYFKRGQVIRFNRWDLIEWMRQQ